MRDLKSRLKNGEVILGTMVAVFDNPDLINMLKVLKFDYFVIDCEHGYSDYGKVANLLGRAKALELPGLVRIPEVKREVVLKYMEMGASGILLPNCEQVAQAQALVEYAKYYPLGNRGVSLLRAHNGYEKVDSAAEYMKKTNEDTLLMIQIESPSAVRNIGDLLDVEGIDAAFIGPNDLSQSMGIMGQMEHPDFIAAVETVIETAKKKNKFAGIHMMSTVALQKWIDKGMTLNLWANEVVMMMNGARDGLNQLKK